MKEHDPKRYLAKGLAISLVLATVMTGLYFLVWRGPSSAASQGYDLFKRASGDLFEALQLRPMVMIEGEVVHGPAVEVTEIVTAEKDFTYTYTYTAKWAGSTKTLKLKGDFIAKAGFPVDEDFYMEISEDGATVTLHHAPPGLIACELKKLRILEDDNGWWNKLQPEDREAAQNALLSRARKAALDADLKAKATENLLERLQPLQQKYAFKAESNTLPK